jgi:hypothetical protein
VTAKTEIVAGLAYDYFWGWRDGNWARLRATLSPDVEFEDPHLGEIVGIDAHMALYTERKRFPDLRGITERGGCNSEDTSFGSYDVYLGTRRKIAVVDQLSIRDGRIVRVMSVTSEWPPLDPSPGETVLTAGQRDAKSGT